MIAPLTPDYPLEYLRPEARMDAFPGIIAKINEVIEAVNRREPLLQLLQDGPGTKPSPNFRLLHIEDDQVQESAPDFTIDEYGHKWINVQMASPSVPEAEPQEQEVSEDCSFLRDLARLNDEAQVSQTSEVGTRLRAIARRFAAAHREYAQPEKKSICEHRIQYQVVIFDGTREIGRYRECFDCKKRIPEIESLAAQPGKGV